VKDKSSPALLIPDSELPDEGGFSVVDSKATGEANEKAHQSLYDCGLAFVRFSWMIP
jgi:hypothetical protein